MPASADLLASHGEDEVTTAALDEFARTLVRQVRDAAIRSCDRQLDPAAQSPIATRWAEAFSAGPTEAVRTAIPDCIDETIFWLLQAIDQGILRLSYTDEAGDVVDLNELGLGELSGWYMGSGGWRAQHSEQRFVDDFADLDGDAL